ncbi:protein of unknown function [Flavobacterium glycines]|uniref:DUF4835 domain-containing protein n=1 Tax=Flavobacterium glycines TaxID=551990 RepID=A0A1B9DZ42_9FLAO|nr:DUF4835 family protein [Flavobacterium glycines]OCB74963.1 hypothetical protein FBGL_00380 [Flavobacterium glycines]GEL11249.1 DUF4835 domain-containing protein [Flavobacterium glycines]SDJ44875.1 protein of unknown function [Flavobacterium glycines]
MNKIIAFFLLLSFGFVQGQQLNCTVTVNAQKMGNPNQQIYKTLETSLNEFVNKTDWTGQAFKQQEKINCSMYITLMSHSSDQFTATIQVQSSRPVFNSSYETPVLNINDKDFSFTYAEFENLTFNANTFQSNLVSVVSFYSYVILGADRDTFEFKGGDENFQIAQTIATVAQQSSYRGWSQLDGNQNRYFLINDLLSPTYSEIRKTVYDYHQGLDVMTDNLKSAKEKVKTAILGLNKLYNSKPNAYLTRVFFDAKSDEITSVFTGGPNITITDLVDNLNKISPINSSKWASLKF